MKYLTLILAFLLAGCQSAKDPKITFQTIDTDFSKGRLSHKQTITIDDLEKFHGHLCDGLVVGALGMQQVFKELYPDSPIDRTNLRVVSKPSPCLTDVAAYLTGGRYQFNTFYVDTAFDGIFIVKPKDDEQAFAVTLNEGVKPDAIDSMGALAVKQQLSPCAIDSLQKLEEDFTERLYEANPKEIFTVRKLDDFQWNPNPKNDYRKTDILNKDLPACNH